MRWQDKFADKVITSEQAAKLVNSGDTVLFPLRNPAMDIGLKIAQRKDELRNVTVASHWTEDFPWFHPGMEHAFTVKDGFTQRFTREAVREKRSEWVPAIFGIDDGERQKEPGRGSLYHDVDIFYFRVTEPDKHGYCSFGHALWWSPTAARTAKTAVAVVDSSLPWTYGDLIHVSELDYLVEAAPLTTTGARGIPMPPPDEFEVAQVIGTHVADLIKDGDTLQIGSGTASEAVLGFLGDKNGLSIDTELAYVDMIELIKKGVVTGKKIGNRSRKMLCTEVRLYLQDEEFSPVFEFVDHNPELEFRDVTYVCNVPRIASIDNIVAINNALAIDLMGQANISHLGPVPLSGPGGQVEYNIGSHYSKGGRSITCLMSTAKQGTLSRIVPQFEAGTGILLPLYYIDYLVTEYGVVNLSCKGRRERAEALISVAHPKFRDELKAAAKKLFWP